MRRIRDSLVVLLMIFGAVHGQSGDAGHHARQALNCAECHTCKVPTYEVPCLKILPGFTRQRGITVHHTAEDAPQIIKIDVLSQIYEPSIFTHKLHAEMAGMAGGCVSCHHFNPPGRIAACRECHDATETGTNLDKPGLKGAYHRQCLNCHRQWSHRNECAVCHVEKGAPETQEEIAEKAVKDVKHPVISVPDKLVYQTDDDEAPIVTFYHDAHADDYGYQCVDCHQNESCSRCHDTMKQTASGEREPHDNCINCHAYEIDEDCRKCHGVEEKARFRHAQTGFELGRYHAALKCRSCHQLDQPAARLNKDCNSCHQDWSRKTFNHQITGLMLDENHLDNDCIDCHINRDFSVAPRCDDCHDELSYPESLPGKVVR